MTKPKTHIIAHTDGACRGNPGPGGWGAVLDITTPSGKATRKEIRGGEGATTNQRMELMAGIAVMESRKTPTDIRVVTDSQYLSRGMNEYLENWRARGWRKSDGKALLNLDLWRRLDTAAARHRVTWQWIKGHSGNEANERADALAGEGLEEALTTPAKTPAAPQGDTCAVREGYRPFGPVR